MRHFSRSIVANKNSYNQFFKDRFRYDPAIIALWILTIIAVILASSKLTFAQTPNSSSAPFNINYITPNQVESGSFLIKSVQEGKYIEAPRVGTAVKIDITGPIARAVVTQQFFNPSDAWVEGVYVFPLPDDSAVDSLKMIIGDRLIEGKISTKQTARKIYEEAKKKGQKASLLEQNRPNIFTNSVANIGPGETITINITYQQTVQQSEGQFSLRFPMVVAPRYNPKPSLHSVKLDNETGWGTISDPVPDREKISPPVAHPDTGDTNPVILNVSLKPGFPLGPVVSSFHEVETSKDENGTLHLSLKEQVVPANKDFELTWRAANNKAPSVAVFKESYAGDEYLLLFLNPPAEAANKAEAREIIFVIDNSGSMGGASIKQAKQSLLFALDRLSNKDSFNIIRFDNTHEQLFRGAVKADQENIAIAKDFVANLEAEGGTEMLPALKLALVDRFANRKDELRQVIFLTDGSIGNEIQLFNEISKNKGRSRIFTVGIGSAPNSFFMTRAAEVGQGTFTHIGSPEQVADRMETLFKKLENPALTNIKADWSGGVVTKISPNPLPDLYLGEPIILTAKAKSLPDVLRVSGQFGDRAWVIDTPLTNAKNGQGIAKLWARRRISELETSRYFGNPQSLVDPQIENTALKYHLVSRLTSLVAVDVTPSRNQEEELVNKSVPLNLPEGWEFNKLFGEQGPLRINAERRASILKTNQFSPREETGSTGLNALIASKAAPGGHSTSLTSSSSASVALPAGATTADQKILIGLMLIAFSCLVLFTIGMWREARNMFMGDDEPARVNR